MVQEFRTLDDSATVPARISNPIPNYYSGGQGKIAAAETELRALASIDNNLNEAADKQAVAAGSDAGLKAGLAPNFAPLRGTSLYNSAYDRAGISAYMNTIKVSVSENASRLALEHPGDPAALKTAMDSWAGGYESTLFDEAKQGFRGVWSPVYETALETARIGYEKNLIDQTAATSAAAQRAQMNDIGNMAHSVRNDQQFAGLLLQQRESFVQGLLNHAPREGGSFEGRELKPDPTRLPVYSWHDIQASMQKFDEEVATQRVMGKFERAPDKEGFQKNFEATARSTDSKVYSPAMIDKISTKMNTEIKRLNEQQNRLRAQNAFDIEMSIDAAETSGEADTLPHKEDLQRMVDKNQLSPVAARTLGMRLGKVTEKIEARQTAMSNVDLAMDGGLALDDRDPVQKEAITTKYSAYVGGMASQTQDFQNSMKANFAARIGVVPEPMQDEIRTGLRSSNPAQVTNSIDMLKRLDSKSPQLVHTISEGDTAYAQSIQTNMELGLTPTDAITKARDAMNIEPSKKKARSEEYDDFVKVHLSEKWIQGQTSRWLSADPDIDAQMNYEFNERAKSAFQENGNMEASRQIALKDIQKNWGRTAVGSFNGWLKYAPEKTYGVPGMSDGENADWMNGQLLEEVKQQKNIPAGITADKLLITPNPRQVTEDGKPTYRVSILDKDGTLQEPAMPVWVPDWQTAPAHKKMTRDVARKVEGAKARRDALLRGETSGLDSGIEAAATGGL